MTLSKKLAFLWVYSLLAVILAGYYVAHWTYAAGVYVYLVVPLLDALFGKDRRNVDHNEFDAVLNDRYFDILVYSFVYLQVGLLGWGAYVLATDPMTTSNTIRFMISLGLFGGTMINVAHELGHRSSRVAQGHAKVALAMVSYMHFFIEHNRGHHVHVATPKDPATSRLNQTIYGFWWQSITGSYRSAWALERKRLEKAELPVWSRHNDMLWFAFWPVMVCSVLTGVVTVATGSFAWIIPVFFMVQSLVAILLLESVNYIEHYGIMRRETAPGRFERVNPLHSWNASQFISNLVLFQLQRHSDHHAYAARPYQVLRHFDESPQLPFGYPLMILMALVPPLWFAVMNPRLEAWQERACQPDEIAAAVRQFA